MKMATLSNLWQKLMLDEDPDLDFAGFELNDFHQALLRPGDRGQCRRCLELVGGKRFRTCLSSPFYGGNCGIGSDW